MMEEISIHLILLLLRYLFYARNGHEIPGRQGERVKRGVCSCVCECPFSLLYFLFSYLASFSSFFF